MTREYQILIVDDTPANLDLLTQILRGRGYRVRALPSGPMALASARLSPPDLVLLDIKMPEMDGYQVCELLKSEPGLKEIPVIFISALDDAWDKVRAFQVGASDYLTKPFQAEEVLTRVHHQIRLNAMQQELVDRARELEEANLRLLELDRMKESFTAMLVHDLRSPLQCIGLILEQDIAGQIEEPMFRLATGAVQNMTALLNDLLDVFRSEGGQLPLELGPLDPRPILLQLHLTHQPLADDRQIHLDLDLPEALPTLEADVRLMERALGNLVGNAVKYTPRGGRVALHAGVREGTGLEEGQRWLVIGVEDTGRGIPAEELPFLFDPFHQAARSDAKVGFGLGLAIVQRIMAAHRGRATVQSQVGVGSLFELWFPLS